MTDLQDLRDRSVAALARHGLVAALGQKALADLVASSTVQTHAPGESLMQQGAPGDHACLILSGAVAVDVAGPLGVATVASLGPGDLVGEMAILADMPRSASVRALEQTVSLRLERASLRATLAATPDLALSVIAGLGQRIMQTNTAISALTQATAALARGDYDPQMLAALNSKADELGHFAATFRTMASEMIEKRSLAQEMQTAATIQRAFLPGAMPATPLADRFALGAVMRPARNVGGDFYDYFMVDDRHLGVAVGDVSGKGTPAAMFMSVARTVLKTVARAGDLDSAGAVLAQVNATLAEDNSEGMFVTLAFGCLNLDTGAFDLASGGHEEIFLLRAGGTRQTLGPTGPALGLFEGANFRSQTHQLDPGDMVVLATDGVTEAFDPDRMPYGWGRLEAMLDARPLQTPAQLVETLEADVAAFVRGAPPSDDLTVLALRFTPDDS